MATLGTFVSGQVLTAAELNAIGTWTNFTPTWANVTVGNGTNASAYCQVNDLLIVRFGFTLGSTSAVTGAPRFTIPGGFTVTGGNGVAELYDSGAPYSGTCVMSGVTFYIFSAYTGGTWGTRGNITATAPFTWATGDQMFGTCVGQIT